MLLTAYQAIGIALVLGAVLLWFGVRSTGIGGGTGPYRNGGVR